jgi:MerR family transcriptional regulator/heat shock protein HspR
MNREEGDEELALYVISVAAELSGLHPQTLRQYDRIGLVSPCRAQGRGRRYSLRDIALLRNVSRMVSEGINLAGIKRIIELESAMSNMAIEVTKLRIDVDTLLESSPEKALVARQGTDLVKYYSQKILRPN